MRPRIIVVFLWVTVATSLAAQQQSAASVPDIEGGWVRVDVDGSGNFSGLAAKFPQAVLTAAAQAAVAEQSKRAAQPRFIWSYSRA